MECKEKLEDNLQTTIKKVMAQRLGSGPQNRQVEVEAGKIGSASRGST